MVTAAGQKEITQPPYTASCKVYIAWINGNSDRMHYDKFSTVNVMLGDEERLVSDFRVMPVSYGKAVDDVIYGSDGNGGVYALGLPKFKTQVSEETVYHTKPFGFDNGSEACSIMSREMQKTLKLDEVVVCSPDMIFYEQHKKEKPNAGQLTPQLQLEY